MLGEKLNITNNGWLSLIFANRNQAYGAYQLRKENDHNTSMALLVAISAFLIALATPTIINRLKGFVPKADVPVRIIHVTLAPPPAIEQSHPLPPPPPLSRSLARSVQSTVIFKIPKVTRDDQAHQDPPTEEMLKTADPGQATIKGSKDGRVLIDEQASTTDVQGSGNKEVTEDYSEKIFTAVEISPEFPGGDAAFSEFLRSHIKYPQGAREENITGRVYVQFIVERDGSLTDVKVLREPGYGLGDEAKRVIKLSPKWHVGIQNGHPVRVVYVVPVNFSLGDSQPQ